MPLKTQNEILQSIFEQHPNEWLSMIDLGHQIGAWAVHSRVADLRRNRCMTIECHKEKDPITRKVLSAYRWVPKASLAILGVMCVLAGCSNDPKPGTYTREGVQFQTICGCEYIVSDIHGDSYGTIYTHKGNCTNSVHGHSALEVKK